MRAPKFWILDRPDCTDYDHSLINGSLEHPFALPGVKCSVCGETSGGMRILPITCPAALRRRKQLTNPWPIPLKAHKTLQNLVRREFAKQGVKLGALFPGDSFQPSYLSVPSRPRVDFLWSSLGSLVVSQRVKTVFEQCALNDVAFSEVKMRKIGRREAKLPAPIPSTGEPEDLINELPLLTSIAGLEPYYEVIILKDSGFPPGGTPKSICAGCGRQEIDDATRKITITSEMWRGEAVFFLATTLYVIVTDPVKRLLQKIGASNVVFNKI